jgi:hypothetical protein
MTDDDLGFDPADTELARRLDSAAPPAGDADAVLAGLRPRLTRARRRRQAGFVAISTAVVVLLAGVTFASVDRGDGSKVRVPPADRAPVTVDTGPPPTTPTVPTTAADDRTPSTTTAPASPGTTTPGSPPTTVDDHGSNRGPGGSSGSDGSGSNSGPGSGSSESGSGSGSSGTSGSGSGSGQD